MLSYDTCFVAISLVVPEILAFDYRYGRLGSDRARLGRAGTASVKTIYLDKNFALLVTTVSYRKYYPEHNSTIRH